MVVKVSVEAQDVGVAEMRLDLNLSPQLVLHVRLLQLVLEQHLQRHDVLAALLTRQVDVAELAAAQRLAYVKVAQLREWKRRRVREVGCWSEQRTSSFTVSRALIPPISGAQVGEKKEKNSCISVCASSLMRCDEDDGRQRPRRTAFRRA